MLRRCSVGMKRKWKGKTTVTKQEDEGEVNDQRKEDQVDPSLYEQVLPLVSNIGINGKAMVIVENAALNNGCVEKGMEDEVERRKEDNTMRDDREKDADRSLDSLLPGIPLAPLSRNPKPPGVIFVLEKASLVPAYVGRSYQILNPDEHADFLRKKNMNPYDYRPDIIHEALLQIMGSRLCMAGGVQAIYIKTVQGVLVKVEPHTHIPKTLGPFCAMMLQLLQKLSIKATGKGEKLLRLVQNPVTKHLPLDSHIIGLSFSSKKAVRVQDYVCNISNDQSLVFVVGAMAHGKIDCDYVNDFVSVSGFPLSAAVCLRRICIAAERQQKIL